MEAIIVQLGFLIVLAGVLSLIGKFLRQPPLVAYIITGLILGHIGLNLTESKETLDILSEVGIILLLYITGLELKIKDFFKTGKHAFLIGEGHDFIMMGIGWLIGYFLLGFTPLQSFYLALALTLSSTIVVVKTLEDRRELESPHGRILIGTMLLQDIVAMASIAIFMSLANGGNASIEIVLTIGKALFVFILLLLLGKSIMTKLYSTIEDQIELVFLVGLMWVFIAVILSNLLDFSVEIGAFIAGLSIAHLPFSFEIKDKTRSLQDFGVLLFFFTIGATATFSIELIQSWQFWLLTIFVLIATPIITGTISSFLGYDKKRNFLMSMLPIQVSEFSLIIVAIGLRLGHLNEYIFSLVTAIALFTIMFSSSILANLNSIYRNVEQSLNFLEWNRPPYKKEKQQLKNHIIIFGMGLLGQFVAKHFKQKKKNILVVDWQPDRISEAKKLGCHVFYGDAGDKDVWKEIKADRASLIISTIGNNQDDDINLINWIKRHNKRVKLIAETNDPKDADELKRAGFNYVLLQDEAGWVAIKKQLTKLRI